MMDGIKEIGFSVSIILIVTGIFSMLVPTDRMEKTMKLTLSVFFLISLVTPFVNADFSFDVSDSYKEYAYEDTALSAGFNEKTKNLTEQYIASQLKNLLKDEGYYVNKITVSVNITAQNSIDISEVVITLPETYIQKEDKIKAVIKENLGESNITFKY